MVRARKWGAHAVASSRVTDTVSLPGRRSRSWQGDQLCPDISSDHGVVSSRLACPSKGGFGSLCQLRRIPQFDLVVSVGRKISAPIYTDHLNVQTISIHANDQEMIRAESAFRAGLHKMFELDIDGFISFQI